MLIKVFFFSFLFLEAIHKKLDAPGQKSSKEVNMEAGTTKPTTATQSTMNKTHTHTQMQHIQRVITLTLGCQNHAENTYGKAFQTRKYTICIILIPPTLSMTPVEFWKLKGERPSGGNVCVLHASLTCMSVPADANSFVIRSLGCKSDECIRTLCSSSFLPSCSSPVILSSESLAEQLEEISPVSGELFIGVSGPGLSPVATYFTTVEAMLVLAVTRLKQGDV